MKPGLYAALTRLRYRVTAWVVLGSLGLIQALPARAAMNVIAGIAAFIGPLTSRHRIALENLRLAFPEKSEDEIRTICKAMWRNSGRLAAEYIFLDQLFDYDPDASEGRIEVQGREIFERLQAEGGRYIFFTGHTGNFEFLPICAATFGLNMTALFRPPNNPYIAKRLLQARKTASGQLIPSKAGAAWALASALDKGMSVGALVDQKFRRGRLATFFGRPVRTNPLVAKLARQYDVPVHPARCVRLDGNRFRLELEEALVMPRNEAGEIDIDAACQLINDTVERWVREYPDQWMWFHRRWQID